MPPNDRQVAVLPSDDIGLNAALQPSSKAQVVSIMDKGQDMLPSLPIPPLEQTLARYLDTVRPLTTDQEYESTKQAVEEFLQPNSHGRVLDQKLRERSEECKSRQTSWLAEWWDEWAYFTHRDSSTFFVNYYFGFQDDTRMPTQTARAALLVSLALEFRQLIATRTLTPDMARNAPFCMNMYNYLFNWSRIAEHGADRAVGFPTESNNHIAVVRSGKFYIFETQHDPKRPNSVLSPREIMIQLERIKKMADDDKSIVPQVGILSTGQRDQAAADRVTLFEAHATNKAHMAKLETSMFVLCLDTSSPTTTEEFSRACWHGDGNSRWFDKCFQLIVFANGRAGMNGEHSKMDATPTSRLCRYMIDEAAARPLPDFRNLNAGDLYECAAALDKPLPLKFLSSIKLEKAIVNAQAAFQAQVDAHEMVPTEFKGYGKGLIKSFGMSPDAYVQMALQLAYFRKHGELVATYESAATRKYRHGRTETARSCSIESKAFCEAMENPEVTPRVRATACRAAVARHAQYTAWAVDGQAVDRHLLGLRLIRDANEPVPAMFQDPVYGRTSRWRLSTSQISDDCFNAYGWGEVVPDGYGCAYMVKEAELFFCVTSLKLGSKDFGQHIVDALQEMRFMFEEVRKIEKAEAAQAAIVAAAAEAMSLAERSAAQAAVSQTTSPLLIPRSPSPAIPALPAPRTSLFFQKHDPVLRTALARNAINAAQEKYFSGIEDIPFDSKAKRASTSSGGRTRSPSNSQFQNFMAILMGEDSVLSRMRPRRASNLGSSKVVIGGSEDGGASESESNSRTGRSSSLSSDQERARLTVRSSSVSSESDGGESASGSMSPTSPRSPTKGKFGAAFAKLVGRGNSSLNNEIKEDK